MSVGDVGHMDIVANRCAVDARVVRTVDLQRAFAERGRKDIRNQMRLGIMILAA